MISDTYKTASTYNVGDLVIYNKKFYICKSAGTTGSWDASKWDETSVAAQLKTISSALATLTATVNGLINDSSTAADKTWSSTKISTELGKIINDATKADSSTWSSNKISTEIEAVDRPVTKTASGNPVEFSDGADAPLVKCTMEIQGTQDLHGYDKPWVGGAGKNLLSSNRTFLIAKNVSGTWTGDTYVRNGVTFEVEYNNTGYPIKITANGTNTSTGSFVFVTARFSFTLDTDYIINGLYNGSINTGRINVQGVDNYIDGDNLITGDGETHRIGLQISGSATVNNVVWYPMLRYDTVTDPTFEPYENICPITAYDECSITISDDDTTPTETITHTATFSQSIYNGSADFVGGKATATWGYIASYNGETLPGEWISSIDEYAPETTPTIGTQVAYELASPTEETIIPTNLPIKSLFGYNHIESGTGDMEVEYITSEYQPIIDITEDYADNAAETAASSMIDDTTSSSTKTWSSNKISSEISSVDTSIRRNIASTYDPTKIYNVGNIVYHNNTLYRCFVDNTTGTWDGTKWRETTVAELIETLSTQPTSWDDVQALVRSGVAPQIFQIGDQLICQKDGVNIVWDVLAHNQDVPTDPTLTRSMTLGMHNIYAMMMFDNKEAAFATETGLTAGTYNFTVGQHPWVSADVGKTYQFTLTQDVPANGQIVFNNSYNVTFNNATVSTYSDGTSTTAIESATMTEGSSGTSLGTINNAGTPASGINSIQRALLGSNNYKESAIRQWLNSDQAAGSVWTPQTKFDRPPDWRNSAKGFMNGLDADFKEVIGEITFNTARNNVSDGGGYDTTSDKFRLLARENVYAGKESGSVDEGGVYDYYSKYSSYSSASTGADTNRIKRYNNSPNWWWLRSPDVGSARNARDIYSDGSLYDTIAVGGRGVVVACNVV